MANWNRMFLANNSASAVLGSGSDGSIPKEVSMSQQKGKEEGNPGDGLESLSSSTSTEASKEEASISESSNPSTTSSSGEDVDPRLQRLIGNIKGNF